MAGHADLDDEALVELANRGDAEAFEALYYRYRDWVVSLAYRFTDNRDDALDVLQDTFAYFFGKFPGFKLTAAIKSFLYPTVKHLCLTRRRTHGPTVDIEDLADELPAPAALLSHGVASDLLRGVADLPAQQREVVLLRFVDDLSLQQIADALVIPLGTVKSRLHHGLETVRRRIAKA